MANSKITCARIREPGCEFYEEGRLCPDQCPGYQFTGEGEREQPLVKPKKPTDAGTSV
jgi:hypothetical protein